MSSQSDKGYVGGQPRIQGTRIWVSHAIANISEMGLEEYMYDFDLSDKKQELKDAIDYCRRELCQNSAISSCQGCNKNVNYPGKDLWKVAEELYKKYGKI